MMEYFAKIVTELQQRFLTSEYICERFTALMEKIFEEEFHKQQQSFLMLTSGNFDIMENEIKILKDEIGKLKKRLHFTKDVSERIVKHSKTSGK